MSGNKPFRVQFLRSPSDWSPSGWEDCGVVLAPTPETAFQIAKRESPLDTIRVKPMRLIGAYGSTAPPEKGVPYGSEYPSERGG